MNEEQVIVTTVQEPIVEPAEPVVEPKIEPKDEIPKFATKEEFDKFVQSTSSKAKGELLKEIGLDKVADIKDLVEKGKTTAQIAQELDLTKAEVTTLRTQLNNIETDGLLKKVGIAPEDKELFLTLLEADKSDLPKEEKAIKVIEKIAKMVGATPKIGSEKTPSPSESDLDKKKIKDLQKL